MKKIILALSLTVMLFSCKSDDDTPTAPSFNAFDYTQEEKDAELTLIRSYIKDNNIEGMIEDESGFFYRIEEQGEGIEATNSCLVSLFSKSTTIDTNIVRHETDRARYPKGESFPIYNTPEISDLLLGFQETIKLLNEGGKAFVFLPSFIHYGKNYDTGIASPVVMTEIELIYVLHVETSN